MGFWDKFDLHMKRWQTVGALIIAVGTIGTVIYGYASSHWPPSWWPKENPPMQEIFAVVRHADSGWQPTVTIDGGINPLFDVQLGYTNISGHVDKDVVVNITYPPEAIPVKDVTTLVNATNVSGVHVSDNELTDVGMNIGDYGGGANAYVRASFTANTATMHCGTNTMPFRAFVRTNNNMDMTQAVYSDEAVVVYNRPCAPVVPGPIGNVDGAVDGPTPNPAPQLPEPAHMEPGQSTPPPTIQGR